VTLPTPGQGGLDEGAARILVVVDAAVPRAVPETHHYWQEHVTGGGPITGADRG